MLQYCTIGQWSTIFKLYSYCRPCRYKNRFFDSIFVLHLFVFTHFVAFMSLISVSFNWWSVIFCNRPLSGLLNSNIAGLWSPCPTCTSLICNKTRFTWVLLWKHFSLFTLQILFMLASGLCFDDGRMMTLLALCSISCRSHWTSLKPNWCLHLTVFI